jgi:hypothetical protein
LSKDISFESDIMVTIYNKKSDLFRTSEEIIGQFSVDINSVSVRSFKPQYFNVLNEEGHFVGQILASFYLTFYKKNPKNLKEAGKKHEEMFSQIEKIMEIKYDKCTAHFSCFGIRDLLKKFKNPIVEVGLTDSKYEM